MISGLELYSPLLTLINHNKSPYVTIIHHESTLIPTMNPRADFGRPWVCPTGQPLWKTRQRQRFFGTRRAVGIEAPHSVLHVFCCIYITCTIRYTFIFENTHLNLHI